MRVGTVKYKPDAAYLFNSPRGKSLAVIFDFAQIQRRDESTVRICSKIQTHRWYSNTLARQPTRKRLFSLPKAGVCVWTLSKTKLYLYNEATADEAPKPTSAIFDLMLGTSR